MAITYVGLAIADSMFAETSTASRRQLSVDEARWIVFGGVTSCCNPSHRSTLAALASKFNIVITVPEKAPFVKLDIGDRVLVLSARFPRRLAEGEVWSEEEVAKAEFKFGLWEVTA